MKQQYNKAFTFAEMIISLMIVATLASMLMMRFKNVSPKETILNYKKTYTTIQQVVAQVANDFEAFPDSELSFMQTGTINNATGRGEFTTSSTYFCENLAKALNTVGTLNCASKGLNITLTNGVQLRDVGGNTFQGADTDKYIENHIDIIVDTNGKKGPNTNLPADKRDRFRIRIYFDGKVTTDNKWTAENTILKTKNLSTSKISFKKLIDAE